MIERKIVTVLFCDLVGFTAASERLDPEDVRSRLLPYHRMLRARLEMFGGTVDKFVGDGVMAVFGAPVAHEDDPERAVRAGLAILLSVEELNAVESSPNLAVRVGINTGQAVVAVGSRADVGEELVIGDVVNIAARIESAAPVGGVAVGEGTYAATHSIFDYRRLDAIVAKGKSESLALWEAITPLARMGRDLTRSMTTPFAGRATELGQLGAVFDRVARESRTEIVTVVGEPGVGKSRLVAELAFSLRSRDVPATWRQGRCLPYGDGVSFWALGEIVKAHAGVLESDPPQTAAAKLDRVLPQGDDPRWMRERLLPLLGVESGVIGPARMTREELFSAWSTFLESMCAERPAVVVVEDLHWADDALLAFLQYVAHHERDIPMMLVCTTRPDRALEPPPYAGSANATTIPLKRLPDHDIASIVTTLLNRRLLPSETLKLVVERSEGNPLYAEECVRLLQERDLLDDVGRLRATEIPFPQGIAALIAARLDALRPEHKSLLCDAAVVGEVFWSGALVAMGNRNAAEVRAGVHELATRTLISVAPESSLADEIELVFSHALVRDVAYGTIARHDRARKHLAVADWVEQDAAQRIRDVAEVLAHHSAHALDLAVASSDAALAHEVTPLARRHALLAADKTVELDPSAARRYLDRVLLLTTPEHKDDADLLVLRARAAWLAGDSLAACDDYRDAIARYRDRSQIVQVGATLSLLGNAQWDLGDPEHLPTLERAVEVLETQPPGPELVAGLGGLALQQFTHGANVVAVENAERALSIASRLGLGIPARALGSRGLARADMGDAGGVTDVERAIHLLVTDGQLTIACSHYNNLGIVRRLLDGPTAAMRSFAAGETLIANRGLDHAADLIGPTLLHPLLETGRLEEVVDRAQAMLPRLDATRNPSAVEARSALALAKIELGHSGYAEAEIALSAAWAIAFTDTVAVAVLAAATARLNAGARPSALEALDGLRERMDKTPPTREYVPLVPGLVRCALRLDQLDVARSFAAWVTPNLPGSRHVLTTVSALIAEANGDAAAAVDAFRDAAARWQSFGNRLEQAYALLGLGRNLLAQRSEESVQVLLQARTLYHEMGARPTVAICDGLLQETTTGSEEPAHRTTG